MSISALTINGITYSGAGALISQLSCAQTKKLSRSVSALFSIAGLSCSLSAFLLSLNEDDNSNGRLVNASVLLVFSIAQFGISSYKLYKYFKSERDRTLRDKYQLETVKYLGERVVISSNPAIINFDSS